MSPEELERGQADYVASLLTANKTIVTTVPIDGSIGSIWIIRQKMNCACFPVDHNPICECWISSPRLWPPDLTWAKEWGTDRYMAGHFEQSGATYALAFAIALRRANRLIREKRIGG